MRSVIWRGLPAAHAIEFSIGEQFDIRDHPGAAKLQHQALIEVKPNC
jgi:hypothetical protein